jgi:hypothetical protein
MHVNSAHLHGRLRAEGRHVRAHEAVRVLGDGLGVHVVVQLHVARVDAENLQAPVLCGDNTALGSQ